MKNIIIYIYDTTYTDIWIGYPYKIKYLLCFPPNPIVVFNIVSWKFHYIANSTCFSVVPAAPTVSENTTKY